MNLRMDGLSPLFEDAIGKGLFPGAVLSVLTGDGRVIERAWGRVTHAPWSPAVTTKTVYDLASLTKPLVTALVCLVLAARKELELDCPLSVFMPFAPPDKASITIRRLLCHTSGLPAHRPYYRRLIGVPLNRRRSVLKSLILDESLEAPGGGKAIYSDLGFMLLGLLLEDLSGRVLDEAAADLVFGSLGIKELRFRPMNPCFDVRPHTVEVPMSNAPTEVCQWRGRMICGEVNDRNAWAAGGVAGHAGLFGTTGAVSRLLLKLLDLYRGTALHPDFPQGLVAEFFKPQGIAPDSTWALGFDTPSPEGSTAGRFFSSDSVGHLGFTGTSFWMDLEKEVAVVLLANRTFPRPTEKGRHGMREFRARLHDEICLMHDP